MCIRDRYRSAQLYYKNYYIAADSLIIDKKNLILEAIGNEKFPALVQIDGGEIEEKERFKLDLSEDNQ